MEGDQDVANPTFTPPPLFPERKGKKREGISRALCPRQAHPRDSLRIRSSKELKIKYKDKTKGPYPRELLVQKKDRPQKGHRQERRFLPRIYLNCK